jgi:hypothetical protein
MNQVYAPPPASHAPSFGQQPVSAPVSPPLFRRSDSTPAPRRSSPSRELELSSLVQTANEVLEVARVLADRSAQCACIANKARDIAFALSAIRPDDITGTAATDLKTAYKYVPHRL